MKSQPSSAPWSSFLNHTHICLSLSFLFFLSQRVRLLEEDEAALMEAMEEFEFTAEEDTVEQKGETERGAFDRGALISGRAF